MYKIAVVLTCIACVGHGRRVHAPSDQLPSSSRALATLLLAGEPSAAFGHSSPIPQDPLRSSHRVTSSSSGLSRRAALLSTSAGMLAALAFPTVALGGLPEIAKPDQDPKDAARLKRGVERIQYFLDNYEELSTSNTGEMNPNALRNVVGLKSTSEPLFAVEKLFKNIEKNLPDDVDFSQWVEAKDLYFEQLNKVNNYAYTASFGEYNPGGGKDQVRKYMDNAKKSLIDCQSELKKLTVLLKL